MPPSPPVTEQTPRSSPKDNEASAPGARHIQNQDPNPRSEPPQYVPTLPPVSALASYGAGLPPSAQPGELGSPATTRGLGMRSILNPTPDMEPPRQLQRSYPSPGRSVSAGHALQSLNPPKVRKRNHGNASPTPLGTVPEQKQSRRMLTPKSPLRSLSSAARASPSGVGHTRLSLAPSEGRSYTAEPGTESRGGMIPPLPQVMMMSSQQGYPPIYPSDPGAGSGQGGFNSSTASYNTYGYEDSQGSPSNAADQDEPSPYRSGIMEPSPRMQSNQSLMSADSQNRGPQRSYAANHSAYEMKLSTEQGTMIVPVELDIQQASKSADEKRKRNAGASARFRQRRKEKEQAASQAIADLQRQMRELTEERDYYLGERNFFRDFALRAPGSQIPPRPPSPSSRRLNSHVAGAPLEASMDYARRDPTEPPSAQRRRTSEYQPTYAPVAVAGSPVVPGNYNRPYPPPSGPSYALPAPNVPGSLQDSRSQPPTNLAPPPLGNSVAGPPTRPPPYDPFRRDPNLR